MGILKQGFGENRTPNNRHTANSVIERAGSPFFCCEAGIRAWQGQGEPIISTALPREEGQRPRLCLRDHGGAKIDVV